MNTPINNQQLRSFLQEDSVYCDITTDILIQPTKKAVVSIIAEEKGVVCGIPIIRQLYRLINPSLTFTASVRDGDCVKKGACIAKIKGNCKNILKGERVALNILQQLSGTATRTRAYVDAVKDTRTSIFDTRKTLLGMRDMQKYAVRCGGGNNHRMDLKSAVLVKDNHWAGIASFNELREAVTLWKKQRVLIEIEVDYFNQIDPVLELGIDIIMLDNFSYPLLAKAVKYIQSKRLHHKPLIEVSGGIKLHNVRKIAQLGVERIAVGAITHSPKILNFTMEFL